MNQSTNSPLNALLASNDNPAVAAAPERAAAFGLALLLSLTLLAGTGWLAVLPSSTEAALARATVVPVQQVVVVSPRPSRS